MTDMKKLDVKKFVDEMRSTKPAFKDAQAIVGAVHNLGNALRRMRERSGLTQAEIGEHLGISAARVSQLESGTLRDAPSLKTLMRFAQVCGETIEIVPSGERAVAAMPATESHREERTLAEGLAAYRDEIAKLRDDLLRAWFERESVVPSGHGQIEIDWKGLVPVAGQQHAAGMMRTFPNQTFESFNLATDTIATAIGAVGAPYGVSVAKPHITNDEITCTLTFKPEPRR
jgi:transcriptional regulator with XRE-family HTH domain